MQAGEHLSDCTSLPRTRDQFTVRVPRRELLLRTRRRDESSLELIKATRETIRVSDQECRECSVPLRNQPTFLKGARTISGTPCLAVLPQIEKQIPRVGPSNSKVMPRGSSLEDPLESHERRSTLSCTAQLQTHVDPRAVRRYEAVRSFGELSARGPLTDVR